MGWADSQLMATRDSCEVKRCNSITVRGCRTQPHLMMAIQSPTNRKEAWTSSACTAAIDTIKNLVIWVRVAIKTIHIKILSYTTNPKNLHFATSTLKFGLAKCSITISYVCSHPSCPRHLAPTQQDRAIKTGNQQLRHVTHI